MKKILLIILLSLTSVALHGQEIKTDEYKDYKPCSECFEKWRKSSNDGFTTTKSSSQPDNQAKAAVRRIGAFFVSLVAVTAGVIIYKKTDEAVNQIH